MKCGYTSCKESYELTKENGIKISTKWYHNECSLKRQLKADIIAMFPTYSKIDMNIALKRAIDDSGNSVEFVRFVVELAQSKIDTPYKILYFLKFDDYKKQFNKMQAQKVNGDIEKYTKENVVENIDVDFEFKPSKSRNWLNIY